MRKTKDKAHEPAFEEGSGNVFADLELDDADERFMRSQLGRSACDERSAQIKAAASLSPRIAACTSVSGSERASSSGR
jgi:hypothetical protein